MSSRFPHEPLPAPRLPMEFPPDPMIIGKGAANTYLNHVQTAVTSPIAFAGLAVPNLGVLAAAALEFETDIALLAQGRTPEMIFVSTPYQGPPLDPTGNWIIDTTNQLIVIARDIVAYSPSTSQDPVDFANGVGLYIALRNQLQQMISTMVPPS